MEYQDYEILFETKKTTNNKANVVVEYDSTSNKPFMVYELNIETMEYEPYSGEDTLEIGIDVAKSLI